MLPLLFLVVGVILLEMSDASSDHTPVTLHTPVEKMRMNLQAKTDVQAKTDIRPFSEAYNDTFKLEAAVFVTAFSTPHPYVASTHYSSDVLKIDGAKAYNFEFVGQTETERGYDFFKVFDASTDALLYSNSGNFWPTVTVQTVNGFYLVLDTDSTENYWGFDLNVYVQDVFGLTQSTSDNGVHWTIASPHPYSISNIYSSGPWIAGPSYNLYLISFDSQTATEINWDFFRVYSGDESRILLYEMSGPAPWAAVTVMSQSGVLFELSSDSDTNAWGIKLQLSVSYSEPATAASSTSFQLNMDSMNGDIAAYANPDMQSAERELFQTFMNDAVQTVLITALSAVCPPCGLAVDLAMCFKDLKGLFTKANRRGALAETEGAYLGILFELPVPPPNDGVDYQYLYQSAIDTAVRNGDFNRVMNEKSNDEPYRSLKSMPWYSDFTSAVNIGSPDSDENDDGYNWYFDDDLTAKNGVNVAAETRLNEAELRPHLRSLHGKICSVVSAAGYLLAVATCFSGTETVALEDGSLKELQDVLVGDRVLGSDADGSLGFSSVVALAHKRNNIATEFVILSTSSMIEVALTLDHLLLGGDCSGEMTLTAASSIKLGYCILTVNGPAPVVDIAMETRKGVYSIITEKEYVIISGAIASPFAFNHWLPHRYYDFYRFLSAFFAPVLTSDVFRSWHFAVGNFFMSAF